MFLNVYERFTNDTLFTVSNMYVLVKIYHAYMKNYNSHSALTCFIEEWKPNLD